MLVGPKEERQGTYKDNSPEGDGVFTSKRFGVGQECLCEGATEGSGREQRRDNRFS